MIDFAAYSFAPVIQLPKDYEVYDFTQGYEENRLLKGSYGVGKYNEKRQNMYDAALFEGKRNIHMGIDIGAPINTAVHAFYEGEVFLYGNNPQVGDYGYTLITKHQFGENVLYALFGHLSAHSIEGKVAGQKFAQGEVLAWVGDKSENGGWNPHLHFQLSYIKPDRCDLPGVVSEENRAEALRNFPDPQLVLGKLY